VKKALEKVDNPCLKLDSGLQNTWRRLSMPAGCIALEEWMYAAGRMDRPVIQTMLVRGCVDNTTPAELAGLSRAYGRLRPRRVYLLTINKPPADSKLEPVTGSRLREIGSSIIGCPVETFA
jgi:wyosine [tRNA(Phe)-imidazoG37] synthetase (radical SAM superfamily)